jgi:hypothetical protein
MEHHSGSFSNRRSLSIQEVTYEHQLGVEIEYQADMSTPQTPIAKVSLCRPDFRLEILLMSLTVSKKKKAPHLQETADTHALCPRFHETFSQVQIVMSYSCKLYYGGLS